MGSYFVPFQIVGGHSSPGKTPCNRVEFLQGKVCARAKCDVGYLYRGSGAVLDDGKMLSSPEQSGVHSPAKVVQSGCCGWTCLSQVNFNTLGN